MVHHPSEVEKVVMVVVESSLVHWLQMNHIQMASDHPVHSNHEEPSLVVLEIRILLWVLLQQLQLSVHLGVYEMEVLAEDGRGSSRDRIHEEMCRTVTEVGAWLVQGYTDSE